MIYTALFKQRDDARIVHRKLHNECRHYEDGRGVKLRGSSIIVTDIDPDRLESIANERKARYSIKK